ncbi:neuronal membrane glycoprotein M6-a isoform X2 [Neocloeon triangulifer]|uniref:neuronal membrane glycoprotein M6-a isoform X2 n=1 Tax=Neocloeon triangulifer TaxID=2078957 RepID=UPI00286F04B6|nr:neuronal membrane glycoprotein M6-a isoform X2 [Neocloeon triangulifer]
MGGCCADLQGRLPYATLIATVMCVSGVGIFCFTIYRGATLTSLMFEHVFHFRLTWLEPTQLGLVIGAASMAALGLMMLFIGCLATGATRRKVYRGHTSRVGGRVTCAIFMVLTYTLQLAWLAVLILLVLVAATYSTFKALCNDKFTHPEIECINFEMFHFFFPKNTPIDDLKVCQQEATEFCKDYVKNAELMAYLAAISCIIVILSLIHYLMCLSANYAHIRDQEKFQDFQEMQFITDPDSHMASKERF